MIRLACFNIRTSLALRDMHHHWIFRREAALAAITRQNADVIGLQEVRAHVLDYISEQLPGYEQVGAARNDGKRKGEFSPLFVGSSLKLNNSVTRWLSDTPEVPGSRFENVSVPRICTIARLTDPTSGSQVAIVNTHLDTQFRSVREQSVALIAKWASQDTMPWIVMGDFNCEADAPEMAPLLDGWTDALAGVKHAGTFSGFKRRIDGPRIDHILVPNGMRVVSAKVDNQTPGRIPSDHWPVVVEVEL